MKAKEWAQGRADDNVRLWGGRKKKKKNMLVYQHSKHLRLIHDWFQVEGCFSVSVRADHTKAWASSC